MWLFPYASWFVIAAIGAVLVAMAFTADLASQLYASIFCTGVVWVAWLVRRSREPRQAR
jgi:GABA permease